MTIEREDEAEGPSGKANRLINTFMADIQKPELGGEGLDSLEQSRDLADALYTLSEGGGWPDYVDSVSAEQAILCWRLIEKLRTTRLPDEYRL